MNITQPPLKTESMKSSEIVDKAIEKARDYLLKAQSPQGYWCGELEADASVSAGYIPLMYIMTGSVDPVKKAKALNYVRSKQKEDGSWSAYQGGPGDLNVTIQVYFALKLAGIPVSEPFLQKSRDFILSRGGVMKANTIVRIWLAIFGQYDWRGTPSIPPELVLLPNWFYFNIYEFASWSRETIMALMLILATRPLCRIPESAAIPELYVEAEEKRHYTPAEKGKFLSWRGFFLLADSVLKTLGKVPFQPLHKMAMEKVARWILEHQEADGSWGGIMLPWVYSLVALKSIGYGPDHPVMVKGLQGLDTFIVEDRETLRLQPAVSPVWDTAWAVLALRESGLADSHPALVRAGRWLLNEEIRFRGDWKIKNPRTEPGGWAFEFDNDFYPDIDDTAVVGRALLSVSGGGDGHLQSEAVVRGLRWVVAMQSRNGGWAAFDRDNNKKFLASVPYADFMTPLDPPSPDVTAHAVELLSKLAADSQSLKRAVAYLKQAQGPDGAWYGRWGVNYLYGTGLTLAGLRSVGEKPGQEYIQKAVRWLVSRQNQDGSWGETCETYVKPESRGQGPGTASQTAWALMGLIAAGQRSSAPVEKGINYLLRNQNDDGSWTEEAYTGTGFPGTFYLRYDLYRVYFPLLALAQYRTGLEGNRG